MKIQLLPACCSVLSNQVEPLSVNGRQSHCGHFLFMRNRVGIDVAGSCVEKADDCRINELFDNELSKIDNSQILFSQYFCKQYYFKL